MTIRRKRVHVLKVTVTLDKPCTAEQALRELQKMFTGDAPVNIKPVSADAATVH